MTTLAQVAWPTITNPLEFITVAIGFIVLIGLIVQLIRTRSISPYTGMPALVSVFVMSLVLVGGSMIDLTQWPPVIATVVGFLTELITSGFLWPYLMVALIAQGVRIVNIMTYGMIKMRE